MSYRRPLPHLGHLGTQSGCVERILSFKYSDMAFPTQSRLKGILNGRTPALRLRTAWVASSRVLETTSAHWISTSQPSQEASLETTLARDCFRVPLSTQRLS
ncbi:hypothetical protein NDU88_000007 [Pleurodeles waltl]|uniref:Uncharacterized protein n=1 Tax=Pleurodeles waltl TaxID=8319 RepID=A0AAV7UNT2_PLEWA|nr:hypothetical protein NDU88_000007 [Pleurodeles waltl]